MKNNSVPIIFLNLPSNKWKFFYQDLGIGYIQAYLKQKEVDSVQYIPERNKSLNAIIADIKLYKPRILGIKCFDTNYYYSKIIAESAKHEIKNLFVVFGGPTATFSYREIMQDCPCIDACVRYEGEYTCYELIKKDFSDWHNINGIILRKGNKLTQTPSRPLISGGQTNAELDILPSPILTRIVNPISIGGILTSRGCIYNCTYCNFSAMSKWRIRYHSTSRILDELRFVYECISNDVSYRNMLVWIYDDTFTLNISRAKDICHRIINAGIKLNLCCETRADHLNEEMLDLMKKAGFCKINFGLESGVPRILKVIKKCRLGRHKDEEQGLKCEKEFLNKIKNAVKLSKKKGIYTSVSIITGLPMEKKSDAEDTCRLVKKLKADEYAHNILRIFPGTELFDSFRKYGLDMKKSEYKIPYITEHAFNVFDVKPLPHASNYSYFSIYNNNLLSLYSGEYRDINPEAPQTFLFENITKGAAGQYPYLEDLPIKFGAGLFFLLKNEEHLHPYQLYRTLTKMVVGHRLFTNEINMILDSVNKDGYKQVFYPDLNQWYMHHLYFVSLADLWSKLKRPLTPFDIFLIDIEDRKNFKEFCNIYNNPNYRRIEKSGCAENIVFVDYCRWNCTDCPQLNSKEFPLRLFLQGNGGVSICTRYNTQFKEKISFQCRTFQQLKLGIKILREGWSEEKNKRGCRLCPVRDRCSKCPNPYPLTVVEFCRLKKSLKISI